MFSIKYPVWKYDEYVKKYIDRSIKNNKRYPSGNLEKYGLPDYRWFIKNCPDKNVNTWHDFLTWIGFYSPRMPKEKAVILIRNYANKLNRPLMYDDFRGSNPLVPNISYINRIWGSLNKMKNDLGFEIIQESMIDRQLSKDEFIKQMDYIFKTSIDNNIQFITRDYIDSLDNINNSSSLDKYAHNYYNQSLADYIKSNGYQSGERGYGCVYEFEDGEKTTSQYEYLFTTYLRELGMVYNIDYKRNIKYSDFIQDYDGKIDCDYVIYINGKTIYVEIPGIIGDYKEWYYNNTKIEYSESKEQYRKKMLFKENLLQDNKLIYFLLFPCDIEIDNLIRILYNPSDELRFEIEDYIYTNRKYKYRKEVIFCGENNGI